MSKNSDNIQIKHFDSYISDTKAISIDEPDKKGLTFARVPFTLSTSEVDAHGEVVLPKGIDLKRFKKNPIVAWAHNVLGGFFSSASEDDIIGKIDVTTLLKTETSLIGDVLFNLTENDDGSLQDPRARKIFDKLNAGILNAGSIGFRSLERSEKNPIKGQTGVTHKKSELIEFSIVPVGSNPNALQKSLEKADDETKELIRKEFHDNFSSMTDEQLIEFAQKMNGTGGGGGDIIQERELADSEILEDAGVSIAYIEKAGKVLSSANEKELNEAINDVTTGVANGVKRINTVLSKLKKAETKPPKPNKDKKDINNENNNSPEPKFELVKLSDHISNVLGEDEIEFVKF